MVDNHLFLFGGGPPFNDSLAERFAGLSSRNSNNTVAILFIERDGWKEYMLKYTELLKKNGVLNFEYLSLSSSPNKELVDKLAKSSGVIISGGETELYRDYIVETDIGTEIIHMFLMGKPVAGFSAGALISPDTCVISPIDNRKSEHLFLKGLGLVTNCVICAHFTKWNEEENLLSALKRAKYARGYGIDDNSGMYLKNGVITQTTGQIYFYYS